MAMGEESGDAPFWKLDSTEILSEDDVQELPTGRRKVGSYHKYMTSGRVRERSKSRRETVVIVLKFLMGKHWQII